MLKALWEWMLAIYEKLPSFSVLIALAGILIVIGLLLYFWAWYAWPKFLVPLHLSPEELKILEVQDQLRKTQIQIPIVIALVATFILAITQSGINSRQWTIDSDLRNTQAQMGQFADAVRAITSTEMEGRVAGIYALEFLIGLDVDRNVRRVNDMLTTLVRTKTTEDKVGYSNECNGWAENRPPDREEAREDVQAAMNVIGSKQYSIYFRKDYDEKSGRCDGKDSPSRLRYLAFRPVLEHRHLDDLNLAEGDFSCAKFSASRFRRTSFQWANLQGTQFDGAIFNSEAIGLEAVIEAAAGEASKSKKEFSAANWLHTTEENSWRRYRCWSTFFEHAFLDGAKFDAARLVGAVFRYATLKNATFNDANISLADFRNTRENGFTERQLTQGCISRVGDEPLHEFGSKLKFNICKW